VRIAERWFEIRPLGDGVTLITEPHVDPLIRCNIWHLRGRDRDLLIDSGLGIASLADAARSLFERPLTAVATHTHYDHVGGLHEFPERVVHRLPAPGTAGECGPCRPRSEFRAGALAGTGGRLPRPPGGRLKSQQDFCFDAPLSSWRRVD